LERAPRSARILDGGAAFFSVLLPWLFLYGYRRLVGVNLSFEKLLRLGPIRYEYGDITRMRFPTAPSAVLLPQRRHLAPVSVDLTRVGRRHRKDVVHEFDGDQYDGSPISEMFERQND
jgi:hypothetical protein